MTERPIPTWRCAGCGDVVVSDQEPPPCSSSKHAGEVLELERVCEICLEPIAERRSDAVTCGGPCRAEKSRRRRSRRGKGQAHTGAPGRQAAPSRKRRRAPEKGARIYLLPDELEQVGAKGGVKGRTRAELEARHRLELKLERARRRLGGRASRA